MGSDEPIGLNCPGCNQFASIVMQGGDQAFCGNDDCGVFMWSPSMTYGELAREGVVKLDTSWLRDAG